MFSLYMETKERRNDIVRDLSTEKNTKCGGVLYYRVYGKQ